MDPEDQVLPHHLRGFKTLDEQINDLRHLAANPKQRIPTGLTRLDDLILGPAQGEVFTCVARSGVGKSLVATNVMVNNPDANILFFSLEMPAHQVIQRIYSHVSGLAGHDVTDLVHRNKVPTDVDALAYQLRKQVVVDADGLTLADMAVYMDNYEAWYNERPNLVIIDYLEEVGGAKASGEGWTRTEATASALKSFSKRMEIGVLSLHQANMKTEEWEPPTSSSCKGGGYTESDVVFGLWRPGKDPEKSHIEQLQQERDLHLNVIKNRITGRSIAELRYVITPSMRIVPLHDQKMLI
jgi:replicative DNA helicase